jgi:RNA ligase (TIGR02306 family)
MAGSNHHAYVVPVVLEPHPDPETTRLSVVSVGAYTCVVATDLWQGVDKAIFIQPDTVVPDTPEFYFLKVNKSARAQLEKIADTLTLDECMNRLRYIEESEALDTSKLHITAVRLRGVQSFGMLWPVPEGSNLQVGDDAWDLMGFQRYEPPLPLEAGGMFDSAPDIPWIHEYDVENYYNWPNVLQEGEEVVATEKIDGANTRYVFARDRVTNEYRMFVGGKSAWFLDTPKNMYWRALRANSWLVDFCKAHPDWTVYGETFGNVQKLKYRVGPNQPNRIRLFDVLAINTFLDYDVFESLFTEEQRAPIIYRGAWDVEKFKELSLGTSTMADHLREGIVVAPIKERNDRALGRVKLKIVSFDLLSKSKRRK